jgi:hypothetical protein
MRPVRIRVSVVLAVEQSQLKPFGFWGTFLETKLLLRALLGFLFDYVVILVSWVSEPRKLLVVAGLFRWSEVVFDWRNWLFLSSLSLTFGVRMVEILLVALPFPKF